MGSTEIFKEEDRFADRHRRIAEPKAAEAYAANPELHAFAEYQSASYITAMCIEYRTDEATEPAVPILQSAFTQLNFAFTNPHDHSETIDSHLIASEVVRRELALTHERGRTPALNELAVHFGFWAAKAFMTKLQLDAQHELEGLHPDDCFAIVKARMELTSLPEASSDHPHGT